MTYHVDGRQCRSVISVGRQGSVVQRITTTDFLELAELSCMHGFSTRLIHFKVERFVSAEATIRLRCLGDRFT